MVKCKIIRYVDDPTDWDGSLRIFLDPRDLNLDIKREYFSFHNIDQITAKLAGATVFSILDANSGF